MPIKESPHENNNPEKLTQLANQDPEHIIALIHGIRDTGHWANTIAELEGPGVRIIQIRYGYVSAILFLCPIPLMRPLVAKVVRDLRNLKHQFKGARLSIIAHSFGTYITLRALKDDPNLEVWKLIFCGSVADDFLDWATFQNRIGDGVRPTMDFVVNDCATADYWPVLGAAFGWYYGKAGVLGFSETHVTNRFHRAENGIDGAGHSRYFETEFARTYWKPFLIGDSIPVKGNGRQAEHLKWSKVFFVPGVQWLAKLAGLLLWLTAIALAVLLAFSAASWLGVFANWEKHLNIVFEFDSEVNRDFDVSLRYDRQWHEHTVKGKSLDLAVPNGVATIDAIVAKTEGLIIDNPGPYRVADTIKIKIATTLGGPGRMPDLTLLDDLPSRAQIGQNFGKFDAESVTLWVHNQTQKDLTLFVFDCSLYYESRNDFWQVWPFPSGEMPRPFADFQAPSTGYFCFIVGNQETGTKSYLGCHQIFNCRNGILRVTEDGDSFISSYAEYKQ
jgi:pimeloyl-ACP methyl ester carboxylesterase